MLTPSRFPRLSLMGGVHKELFACLLQHNSNLKCGIEAIFSSSSSRIHLLLNDTLQVLQNSL